MIGLVAVDHLPMPFIGVQLGVVNVAQRKGKPVACTQTEAAEVGAANVMDLYAGHAADNARQLRYPCHVLFCVT